MYTEIIQITLYERESIQKNVQMLSVKLTVHLRSPREIVSMLRLLERCWLSISQFAPSRGNGEDDWLTSV